MMNVPARSRGEAEAEARRSFVSRRIVLPAQSFIHTEGLSGYVLVLAATIAVIWANSRWADVYFSFRELHLGFSLGGLHHDASLQEWVNDGLMTLFFFVAGLEIKRELAHGELSDLRRASLPIVAALGGMIVPAGIYAAINFGTDTIGGWGVPMATDIAFALGVLSLLGERIPTSVRVLLLALAIVDDIGAILVIAVFYSHGVALGALGVAFALAALILLLRAGGLRQTWIYVLIGILMWLAVSLSGVHATLAGVALGLLTSSGPWYSKEAFDISARKLLDLYESARTAGDPEQAEAVLGQFTTLCQSTEPPLDRAVRSLHPWTSFLVLPLFALFNAGVSLSGESIRNALTHRVALGVALGLVLGKGVGVLGACWLAVRLGLASRPNQTTWSHLAGVAMLAGIGFTVSLFITDLAFASEADRNAARIAILLASILAGIIGFVYLRWSGETA